jgi:hypothetical protein
MRIPLTDEILPHGFKSRFVILALLFTGALTGITAQKPDMTGHPRIEITMAPPASEGGPQKMNLIQGKVEGAIPAGARVVIYVFAGDTWWVQPTVAEPYTQIGQAGKWSAVIHLGQVYSALLVTKKYSAPAKLPSMPSEGGEVLAVATAPGR